MNPVKPQAAQSRPVHSGRARAGEAGADAGAHQVAGGQDRVGRRNCSIRTPGCVPYAQGGPATCRSDRVEACLSRALAFRISARRAPRA